MTCREFADFLADYMHGELRPETQAAFEHHLAQCVNCVRYLDHYRQTIALERRVFDDLSGELPDTIPEDLLAAIVAARGDLAS